MIDKVWQYQSRFEPVWVSPTEDVTLDKWESKTQQPAVRHTVSVAFILATLFFTEIPLAPAAAWSQSTSQPTRVQPRQRPGVQHFFAFFVAPKTSVPELSWYQETSQPYRIAKNSVRESISIFSPLPIPNEEVPLLGGSSSPTYKLWQYQALTEPFYAAYSVTETIHLDKWYQPLQEPIRKIPRPVPGVTVYHLPIPTQVPDFSWFCPVSEPIRKLPRPILPYLAAYYTDEVVVPPAETVTLDKWWTPISQPYRVTGKLVSVGISIFYPSPIPAATPDLSWFQPLQQPVKLIPRSTWGITLYILPQPTLAPEMTTWYRSVEQPYLVQTPNVSVGLFLLVEFSVPVPPAILPNPMILMGL